MTITTMDACRLNVFHDTHDMHVLTIADGIYLRFLATIQEVVDKYFIIRQVLQQADHTFFQLLVINNDTHTLATQYVGRTYQNRVAYLSRHFYSLICSVSGAVFWIRDTQL